MCIMWNNQEGKLEKLLEIPFLIQNKVKLGRSELFQSKCQFQPIIKLYLSILITRKYRKIMQSNSFFQQNIEILGQEKD